MNRQGAAKLVFALALTMSVLAWGGVVAAEETGEASYAVEVDSDGDVVFAQTLTYQLDDDVEREVFGSLERDAAASNELRVRFRDRMRWVADAVEHDVQVGDVDVDIEEADGVGRVTLKAEMTALAEVSEDGDTATLLYPFGERFSPDAAVVVEAPEGFVLQESTPEADRVDGSTVEFGSDAEFTGFELVFQREDVEEPGSEGLPGFTAAVAFAAIAVAAVGIALRRKRSG